MGSKSSVIMETVKISTLDLNVKLTTKDGGSFSLPRASLVHCSSYFRYMLLDETCNNIAIPGVTADLMTVITNFIKRDMRGITEDNVKSLMLAARQLCIKQLETVCSWFMRTRMNSKNCIGIWIFARKHNFADLAYIVNGFLAANFKTVMVSSIELMELPLIKILELLTTDSMFLQDEKLVWEMVIRWVQHDMKTRKKMLQKLVCHIKGVLYDGLNCQWTIEKCAPAVTYKPDTSLIDTIFKSNNVKKVLVLKLTVLCPNSIHHWRISSHRCAVNGVDGKSRCEMELYRSVCECNAFMGYSWVGINDMFPEYPRQLNSAKSDLELILEPN